MQSTDSITLSRDCDATLVPSGTRVTLLKGEAIQITQALGGSYTVVINGNMARIEGKDADAIGKDPIVEATMPKKAEGPVDEKLLWDQMRTCFDPEIPVNIVDLGLIYDCKVSPTPEGGNQVHVKMTLTAPGCGMGPSIASDVERKLRSIPNVTQAQVELVWEPNWNQSMMSEAAKLQLGLL